MCFRVGPDAEGTPSPWVPCIVCQQPIRRRDVFGFKPLDAQSGTETMLPLHQRCFDAHCLELFHTTRVTLWTAGPCIQQVAMTVLGPPDPQARWDHYRRGNREAQGPSPLLLGRDERLLWG